MIAYRVLVETPYHGELFEARCRGGQIVAVLAAAAEAVEAIEAELRDGIPLRFEVTAVAL